MNLYVLPSPDCGFRVRQAIDEVFCKQFTTLWRDCRFIGNPTRERGEHRIQLLLAHAPGYQFRLRLGSFEKVTASPGYHFNFAKSNLNKATSSGERSYILSQLSAIRLSSASAYWLLISNQIVFCPSPISNSRRPPEMVVGTSLVRLPVPSSS